MQRRATSAVDSRCLTDVKQFCRLHGYQIVKKNVFKPLLKLGRPKLAHAEDGKPILQLYMCNFDGNKAELFFWTPQKNQIICKENLVLRFLDKDDFAS